MANKETGDLATTLMSLTRWGNLIAISPTLSPGFSVLMWASRFPAFRVDAVDVELALVNDVKIVSFAILVYDGLPFPKIYSKERVDHAYPNVLVLQMSKKECCSTTRSTRCRHLRASFRCLLFSQAVSKSSRFRTHTTASVAARTVIPAFVVSIIARSPQLFPIPRVAVRFVVAFDIIPNRVGTRSFSVTNTSKLPFFNYVELFHVFALHAKTLPFSDLPLLESIKDLRFRQGGVVRCGVLYLRVQCSKQFVPPKCPL